MGARDHMAQVLAVIPARAGSRELPRKNLAVVAGRSLVEHAAHSALEALEVDRVVGSTDSDEIAAMFRRSGVEVPAMRPAELSGDEAPDAPVVLHMLSVLADAGYAPDIVVYVRPTSPLRLPTDIDAAIRLLRASTWAQSVKSVSIASEHPYKTWYVSPEGQLEAAFPRWRAEFGGDPDVSRHLLPRIYRSNGVVDAVRVPALLETKAMHPGRVVAYVMDGRRAIDIDSASDLAAAELRLEGERP